jgi:hypothetical protein
VESKRALLTNLVGLTKRKRTPQKVIPNPIKARIVEEVTTEATSSSAQATIRVIPILLEGIFLEISSSCFSSSFSLRKSSRVFAEGVETVETCRMRFMGISRRIIASIDIV